MEELSSRSEDPEEGFGATVTVQLAVRLPSSVVTVITAVPAETALTTPFSSTVATSALSLAQVILPLVAFSGATVAVSVPVSPTVRDISSLSRLTPVTGTVTVTVQLAVRLPSSVVTVMTAAPAETAVTTPFSSTVATVSSLLVHVTF